MKLVYPAVFYPCENGEGFTVEFPDLPGCVTQGDTLEEAMEMAVDAASSWILVTVEDEGEIPSPTRNVDNTKYPEATFQNYIIIDMDEYAKLYGSKAVKKTLTIPRWLNTLAEKKDINFSQLLQKSLKSELKLEINDATYNFHEYIYKIINSYLKSIDSITQKNHNCATEAKPINSTTETYFISPTLNYSILQQ